jgi:hypothetical protein
MKTAIIKWLLRRLGYPTHRLVTGAPSMLVVQDFEGVVVFTTTQAPHVARAKCRELIAAGKPARLVLYRAIRTEPC